MNTQVSNAAQSAASNSFATQFGWRGRRVFVFSGLVLVLLAVLTLGFGADEASAQGGTPPNQPRRGLIFDGLKKSKRQNCQNGYEISLGKGKKPLCTHGPDPVPEPLVGEISVPALTGNIASAQAVCDGDGFSGRRFQVLYAHAVDVPSRLTEYSASIQQWAIGADDILNASAAETGSSRHFRFVTDGSCLPVIQEVTLSTSGDDNISNFLTELQNQGFNQPDRNYVVFTDSTVYCGIATMTTDDSVWNTNRHNSGSFYARIDARCWGAWAVAHEMMHTLGSVQMTAPHTSGAWHCTDAYDVMCYQDTATTVVQYPCDSTHSTLFDCNHDDYFNPNPAPGSYLATHWNTAFNEFLVYQHQQLSAQSIVTGNLNAKGKFVATDTFKLRGTVYYKATVQNVNGGAISNARVTVEIIQASGTTLCKYIAMSDANGMVASSCVIPRNASTGTYQAKVTNIETQGSMFASTQDAVHYFQVTRN